MLIIVVFPDPYDPVTVGLGKVCFLTCYWAGDKHKDICLNQLLFMERGNMTKVTYKRKYFIRVLLTVSESESMSIWSVEM